MKLSRAGNDNLINRTIRLWQPRSRRSLSREDARQIVENVTGFFSILHEWSRAESVADGSPATALAAAIDEVARILEEPDAAEDE